MTCKDTLGKLHCNLIPLKLETAREIFFLSLGPTFPLYVTCKYVFLKDSLVSPTLAYQVSKIQWNIMLCFARSTCPEECTTEEDSGDEAFPSSSILLALHMLISRIFRKDGHGFLCCPYPILGQHHGGVGREEGCPYSRAWPWKCHPTCVMQLWMWINYVNTQKLAISHSSHTTKFLFTLILIYCKE